MDPFNCIAKNKNGKDCVRIARVGNFCTQHSKRKNILNDNKDMLGEGGLSNLCQRNMFQLYERECEHIITDMKDENLCVGDVIVLNFRFKYMRRYDHCREDYSLNKCVNGKIIKSIRIDRMNSIVTYLDDTSDAVKLVRSKDSKMLKFERSFTRVSNSYFLRVEKYEHSGFKKVGYIDIKFTTIQEACEYYNKHRDELRKMEPRRPSDWHQICRCEDLDLTLDIMTIQDVIPN